VNIAAADEMLAKAHRIPMAHLFDLEGRSGFQHIATFRAARTRISAPGRVGTTERARRGGGSVAIYPNCAASAIVFMNKRPAAEADRAASIEVSETSHRIVGFGKIAKRREPVRLDRPRDAMAPGMRRDCRSNPA